MKKIMHSKVMDFHGCRDTVPENEVGDSNNVLNRLSSLGKSVNSFILLLGLFLFSNASIAQTITVDGNPEDWDAENFAFFSVKSYVLDAFGTGQVDNQFTSSKDFFFADGTTNEHLTWVIGQTKAKNDIANAAAVLDDNGVLYFAGDRTSNNGDAQIGFWFFLNGTSPRVLQTSPDGGDFAPAHAVGDILILADFTNGGSLATVQIFQWVGTGGNVPNTNGRLNTTSLSGTVAINNASAYPIPDGWTFLNPTYDTNEFYEGQVDLSSLNLTNTCFSSFLLEARASQSVTASLDDFAGGNFNVQPEVTINDVTVCSGGQATFTAVVNGGIEPITYSFNGGPFTANNVFTIDPATSSTTVTVIAQGAGPNFCESEPATGNLTVIDAPDANAGPDKELTCTTTSIALSGSSSMVGATFSWVASNGGNIVSGADTATPTVDAAGTYTLTVTSPVGNCTATDFAVVTLNNTPPNANAGADKELTCTTTSIALSGSSSTPGATFAWVASNGGNIVSGANTATPTVNAAGTYTLTVTNPANGCTATDVALVTLNNTPPNVNAGADKVLTCTTTSIALSGSSSTPGATFAWVASNGGNIVSGANTATPTVNAAGTYTLTVTNPANGCTATDVALVTLNGTPPNVNAGADKVLTCTTTSIALSGSSSTPGATFAWVASNGGNIVSGANTATPTVNAAGTYTLTVTNPANGCTATDVALVTLNNTPPNVNAGADKELTCTTTSIALSGSSSTPGATFAWVASNGGNIVSGANTATPTVNAAGTYTLTVTNPANGCTATDVALVTLNNTPPNVNAGADKELTCTTTSIALSGSSSTPGATFAWVASNGGNIVSGANTATPTVNAAGTYTLTVTNPANGCTATDVALVTLNNTPPNVNAGPDKELTCVVSSIALSGSSSTPGATFAWVASNGGHIVSGANTATPTVDAIGTYTLTVTNPANGCTASDFAVVTLNNTPPNASAGDDASIPCGGSSTSLSGSSSTLGATFAWVASNGGNIISGADTATPTVTAGTYTVTVTNPANGCTASDSADVTIQNCRTFCTYTQGYYGNKGGIACTPDGQSTTYNLILNSLLNMPGEYMYIGRGTGAADPGGSFTATPADVNKIIEIMPGNGPAASITGDYTPYTVQPLQNGKIRNVLLGQTIALALNLYMPADLSESVGNFSLEGSGGMYLVTAARATDSSCEDPVQADCLLQPNAIQSSQLPIPANVIAALPAQPKVWDLFQLAKNALGGLLPPGVTHSNINDAVAAINVGFDKCRFFVEFSPTTQACPPLIIAKAGLTEVVDVDIYPVPFKDNLTMTYRFESNVPVTIEVYDIRGVLLSTQTDTDVRANKEITIPVNFTKQQAQMYFVKISSDKGTIIKKVISE
ncbi:T9SS type A sorting domain-containing protein [Flavobacterium terrisoli]|uniref:T9SS type A sorting domain-containing protein n=1 Tax=Flavobacterium terrisoli TaxID=3242195 RepID=UPI0025429487|nr:T9SS type A sorting domain-containing protein [Flavobacterium buctense]